MKLREIYETAVRMGIEADPRGASGVDDYLAMRQSAATRRSPTPQGIFDPEELKNPYIDTRIYVGDPDTEVKTLSAAST